MPSRKSPNAVNGARSSQHQLVTMRKADTQLRMIAGRQAFCSNSADLSVSWTGFLRETTGFFCSRFPCLQWPLRCLHVATGLHRRSALSGQLSGLSVALGEANAFYAQQA